MTPTTTPTRRHHHRHRARRALALVAVAGALLAAACTQEVDETGQPVSEDRATDANTGSTGASGDLASTDTPSGYGACPDSAAGQSYHACVWTLNKTFMFAERSEQERANGDQPKAGGGVNLRFEGIDQPWGKRDGGGGGPDTQVLDRTFGWTFWCAPWCGPEATIKYSVDSPYSDSFSVWVNVDTGAGADRWECRWGRWTSCHGQSMTSDEDDLSVAGTFTNWPYLVQIESTVKGTWTRTSSTTNNLMTLDRANDPLTPPTSFTVPASGRTATWFGGFQEVGKDSSVAVSYVLSGNGSLDRSTVQINAALDSSGKPKAPKTDSSGKVVVDGSESTWCQVIRVGSANLNCRISASAGRPDVFTVSITG